MGTLVSYPTHAVLFRTEGEGGRPRAAKGQVTGKGNRSGSRVSGEGTLLDPPSGRAVEESTVPVSPKKRFADAETTTNYGWLNPYMVVSAVTLLSEVYF